MIEKVPGSGPPEFHSAALERSGLLDGNEQALIKPELEVFKKEGPGFSEFTDIYSPHEIGADVAAVEKKREKAKHDTPAQKERELYATVLEMVLMEFGNAWLPGSLTRASEFDDFERGTDVVLEIPDRNGVVHRLGLDVVSGRRNAEDKLLQITDNLFRGKLNELKYFESDLEEDIKGSQEMPRIVVGTDDLEVVAQLARLYLNHQAAHNAKNQVRVDAIRETIENHPLGRELLIELLFQLKTFPDFLRRALKQNPAHAAETQERIARMQDAERALGEDERTKSPDAQEGARAARTNKVLKVIMSRLEPVAA